MATSTVNILSAEEKVKLQAVLLDVVFVNNDAVESFKCTKCRHVALFHFKTKCQHVLCAKCHGRYHRKHCPAKQCSKFVNKVTQNPQFEQDLFCLQVFCKFKQNGCEEIIRFDCLLDHQKCCRFSPQKLLPKIWNPPENDEYVKQLEEEVEKLKTDVEALQKENKKLDNKLRKVSEKSNTKWLKLEDQMRKIANSQDQVKQELETFSDRTSVGMSNDQPKNELKNLEDKLLENLEAKSRQMTAEISIEISDQLNKKIESKSCDIKNKITQELQKSFDLKSNKLKNQLTLKFANDIKDLKLDKKVDGQKKLTQNDGKKKIKKQDGQSTIPSKQHNDQKDEETTNRSQ